MTRGKLIVLGKLSYIQKEWDELSSEYDLLEFTSKDREEFINDLKGKYSGLTGIFSFVSGQKRIGGMDKELIKHLPDSLKFVCHSGAGYNVIDVDALTERKIQVSNVTTSVQGATSDTAIYLMLGALRNFNRLANDLRRGDWNRKVPEAEAHDPAGKVFGILGLGGVGSAIRDKSVVFGFKEIIYHNRRRLSPEKEGVAKYVGFEELLEKSDVLSLTIPLNNSTRRLFNAETLAKCKDGVVIINVGRGGLIDEDALVNALESGKVSTVGLDSFENEPTIHPGLLENENVLLLPHIGTHSYETRREMELATLRNVVSALETGKVINLVPEQVGHF